MSAGKTALYMHKKLAGILKSLLLMICLLPAGKAVSQNPPYISYNEQNGISTNVVYGLFQDSEDNIWFCTNIGVVKFNGKKLTQYGKKDGIPGNEVFKIFEDGNHRLWLMTASGRPAFYKNGKIYNDKDYPVLAKVRPGTFISDIGEDAQKGVWIISDKGNIYCLSPDLKTCTEKTVPTTNNVFFKYGQANYISSRQGVYQVSDQPRKVVFSNYDSSGSSARHCFAANKVFTGRQKRVEVFDMQQRSMSVISTPGLPDNFNAVVYYDSLLYLCTLNGLSIYDTRDQSPNSHYFRNMNVSHVLKDKEGSLWVSTLNDGVMYVPNMRINLLKSSDFFNNSKVLKLDGLGNLVVVGQSNCRADYYRDGVLRPIAIPSLSRGEGLTYMVRANPSDSSFYISNQAGFKHFSLRGQGSFIKNIAVLGYAGAGKDSVYISTPTGLNKFSRNLNESFFKKQYLPSFFDNIRAGVICVDTATGILYASTKDGLRLYKDRQRIPSRFKIIEGTGVTDIAYTAGKIFIASTLGDGVFLFNNDTCIQVKESDGLSDNLCSSVFILNDSTAWVTTLHGLNRITFRYTNRKFAVQIKNFYRNDGLPANYINDIYMYRDSIWLATNAGLAIFNEKDLINNAYTPRIAVEGFKSNGQDVELSPVMELERNSNNIVIEFNCRTFKNAGSVIYKYKLHGLSSNWVETKNNQVDFSALAPGNYTFEVYAYSSNAEWRTAMARVRFNIKPAFWETIWFRILAAVLLLLGAVWIVYTQFRKVKNKFALQQKVIHYEKELLELEQQALRLQMNPHFIFNAMNSIQHAILSGKQNDAYNSLELFSSLIRGILENSKYKFISLEDEIEILKIYIEIEAKRFSSDFTHEVMIDPEIDLGAVRIPPMLIQPFVENSIWHGLMPKTAGEKKLTLSFAQTTGAIICKIEDNGVGRNKAASAASRKQGTSLGTSLTFNRVANINMLEKRTRYTIEIFDKPADSGTIVTITILQ